MEYYISVCQRDVIVCVIAKRMQQALYSLIARQFECCLMMCIYHLFYLKSGNLKPTEQISVKTNKGHLFHFSVCMITLFTWHIYTT